MTVGGPGALVEVDLVEIGEELREPESSRPVITGSAIPSQSTGQKLPSSVSSRPS